MNWKKFKKIVSIFIIILLLIPAYIFAQDITSPNADYSEPTLYKKEQPLGSGNWVNMSASEQDSVFVFCSSSINAGTLTAPAGTTYQWGKLVGFTYVNFGTSQQTVTGLESGGYKVVVTTGTNKACYYAWVFVNQTIANLNTIVANCGIPFNLSGSFSKISDFTVSSPPDDPIIIDASTQIEVCFTANHTFVSDLGFYLVAPNYGYGTNCIGTPANPLYGDYGIVELLPPVSNWSSPATTQLPESVLSCSSWDINTNCNSGNDVDNFCFTTAEPFGNPAYTACVCDLPTPLTGTYASCGPWSTIYGQQVPTPNSTPQGCGWSIQIYDCEAIDVGALTNATIKFTGNGECGQAVHYFDSGNILSSIDDESCSAATASRYVIPQASPYSYTVSNTITSAILSCSPGNWIWGSTDFLADTSARNINPPPTENTWFILTVTDNFGCVKIDSSLFVTSTDSVTITPAGPFCANIGDQQLVASPTGGSWSGDNNCVSSAGLFHTTLGAGNYNVTYSIGGDCPDSATYTIIVKPELTVTNIYDTCDGGVIVSFIISGGNISDFVVTGMSGGTINPTTGEFISNPILGLGSDEWTFLVENTTLGCGSVTISDTEPCLCSSNAGTISSTLVVACESECVTSDLPSSTFAQDSYNNDTLVYYLHTSPLNQIIDSIDANLTGTFCFNPATMQYNIYYYISAAAGNKITITNSPYVWVDMADSCLDIAYSTPVMWLKSPEAIAGSDTSICGKTIHLNASMPDVGNGQWATTCGSTFISSTTVRNPEVVSTYGTCTFSWIVNNTYGTKVCSDTDYVDIIFKPLPSTYAGSDTSVCGKIANLSAVLSVPGLSTGEWSGPGTFSSPSTENTTASVGTYGTFTFTWTETGNGTGGCVDEDDINVTFVQAPEPVLPLLFNVCGDTANIIVINATVNGNWTVYPSTSGSFPDTYYDDHNDTTIFATNEWGIINFIWDDVIGQCYSHDTMEVNFLPYPKASIRTDQTNPPFVENEVCGCTTTLYADTTGSSYPGFWDCNIAGAIFSDVDSIESTITIPCNSSIFANNSYIDVDVYWRQYNSSCTDMDIYTISFFNKPYPDAGSDTISCSLTAQLDGTWSLGDGINDSYFKWNNLSTGSATFSSDTILNPIVNVNPPGVYEFELVEFNKNLVTCANTDSVIIEFIVKPYFTAGTDTVVCGNCVQLNATPANPASNSVNWWPRNNTSGVTYNPSDTVPDVTSCYNYSGNTASLDYEWRETTLPTVQTLLDLGYKCEFKDAVNVTFNKQPVASYTPYNPPTMYYNDTVACGLSYTFFGNTSTIQGATYNLIDNYVATIITANTTNANQFDVLINDTTYGFHNLYYIVNNGICSDTIDEPLVVNFYKRPSPDAGQPLDTACGLKFGLEATNLIAGSTVTWSSLGSSVFFDVAGGYTSNNIIETASVGQYDYIGRVIRLTESVGPSRISCNNYDEDTIKFVPIPFGDFTFTAPKCFGDIFSLAAVDNAQPLFTWTESLDILNYGSSPNLNYAWCCDTTDTTHNVTLVSTNIYNCPSIPVTKLLTEPPVIKIDFDVTDAECSYYNGSLTATASGGLYHPLGYFTYTWDAPITTNVNNQTQDSLYYGRYIVSVSDSWDCEVSDTVFIQNLGATVVANFDTQNFQPSYNAPASITFTNMSIDANYYVWYFNNSNQPGLIVDIKDIQTNSIWNPTYTFNPKVQFLNSGAKIDTTDNPTFTYDDGGDFWVFLIAISEYGCVDTMYYYKIHVEYLPVIEVPNVFTPNGDGINDLFTIKVKSLQSFSGVIFNRWGHKVYEWNDPADAGWDGKVNGGSLASPGTYYYMLEGVGKDGTEFSPKTENCEDCKGFLQLIRD